MTHMTPGGLMVYGETPDMLGGICTVQESSNGEGGVWIFYTNRTAQRFGAGLAPHLNGEQIDRVIAALQAAKARQYPDGETATKGE